jgi:phosphatidyl-myo-inositol alpha-mannosyltransferase
MFLLRRRPLAWITCVTQKWPAHLGQSAFLSPHAVHMSARRSARQPESSCSTPSRTQPSCLSRQSRSQAEPYATDRSQALIDPLYMWPTTSRHRIARPVLLVTLALVLAALLAFAASRLNLPHVANALISASPGWIVAAFALMMLSLFLRALSWRAVLRAALPHTPVPLAPVARATMIGVMASAVLPGRIGEPTRVVVLSRRLPGRATRTFPVVAGTVLSQTLINLVALGILGAVTFASVPLLQGHASALEAALAVPLFVALFVFGAPFLLRVAQRSRSLRIRAGAIAFAGLLRSARRGLVVFTTPRYGVPAIGFQLLAWALQWGSCYMVVLALGLNPKATPVTAAAILLVVNVTAVVPATPSNVGVFQAACLVVLSAYGVGAGPALAYGIILQAIELLTALALGVPALLREGMTWQDIRRGQIEPEGGQAELDKQAYTETQAEPDTQADPEAPSKPASSSLS